MSKIKRFYELKKNLVENNIINNNNKVFRYDETRNAL